MSSRSSSTTSAQPRSLSSGTRWVATPSSTPRDGSVTAWVDVLRSLGNETVSTPEQIWSRPSATTTRQRSIDSCADSFPKPSTAGWSIASRPTWPPLPERPRSARWPTRAPPARDPRGAATHRGTGRCDQPRHRQNRRRLAPPAHVEPIHIEDVGHFPMIEAPDRFNVLRPRHRPRSAAERRAASRRGARQRGSAQRGSSIPCTATRPRSRASSRPSAAPAAHPDVTPPHHRAAASSAGSLATHGAGHAGGPTHSTFGGRSDALQRSTSAARVSPHRRVDEDRACLDSQEDQPATPGSAPGRWSVNERHHR